MHLKTQKTPKKQQTQKNHWAGFFKNKNPGFFQPWRQELAIKSLTSQMQAFDRRDLRHTQPVERNSLPDADTLRQERGKADLLSGREQAYLLVTCGVVSGPPRRWVEDTSGLCSGLPSSPGGLDRLSRRAFHID